MSFDKIPGAQGLAYIRKDLFSRKYSVPVGNGYYSEAKPLPYRWGEGDGDKDFQVFLGNEWQTAESINWDFDIRVVPAKDTETLRSKVKDAIREFLEVGSYTISEPDKIVEDSANLADDIFDALGISPEEQDIEGGVVTVSTPQEYKFIAQYNACREKARSEMEKSFPPADNRIDALLMKVLRCLNSTPRFKFDNSDSYEMAREIENVIADTHKRQKKGRADGI